MATLQTVIDVLKSESESGVGELSGLEQRLANLQQDLVNKGLELEEVERMNRSVEESNRLVANSVTHIIMQ